MYRIVACDDCDKDCGVLESAIARYFTGVSQKYVFSKTNSGNELLKKLKAYSCDILFLDVEMPGENGIDIAKAIRAIDDNIVIIFLSSHPKYVFSSFCAEPLRYLLKPLKYDEFEQAMRAAIEKCREVLADSFSLTFNGEARLIPCSAIMFFESVGRVVNVAAKCETLKFYASLNEIEAKLDPDRFVRVHQSYIVNLQYVRRINGLTITTNNQVEIPVSRAKKKSVNDAFLHYLGELVL